MERLMVIKAQTAKPEIYGLFPGNKVIFFGKIKGKEFCALTIPEAHEAEFLRSTNGFTEQEVTLFYGKNLLLTGYPLIRGNKVIERGVAIRWYCQANADKLKERTLTIALHRKTVYQFNQRPFQEIFITF